MALDGARANAGQGEANARARESASARAVFVSGVRREVFEECSRRRYLALSELVKARFSGSQASSRTRYMKLWRRFFIHLRVSLAMARAVTEIGLVKSADASGRKFDLATIAFVAVYESYAKVIDSKLQLTLEQSLKRVMESKQEKEKVVQHELDKTIDIDSEAGEFNPMEVMRSLRKLEAEKPTPEQFQGAEEEVGVDHTRLLYLISQYTSVANRSAFAALDLTDQSELWLRKTQLLVLIYECIRAKALDYDYAPMAQTVGTRRMWLNISQEGVDDLDDMREVGFLVGLKLSSKNYTNTTAFRLTDAGYQHLKVHLRRRDKAAIDEVIYSDKLQLTPRNLFLVEYNKEDAVFCLRSASGVERVSDITDIEEISYVSSPYVPKCIRRWGRECSSNKSQAALLANATHTIRDNLDEQLTFDRLRVLVSEWIPMGANQTLSLNDKIGSVERVSGGYFTNVLDQDPANPLFQGNTDGLTRVSVLDFDETAYVNFEADIQIEELQGIVQIESFGIHVSEEGFLLYGLTLEGMMEQVDGSGFSIDNLARLLRDVGADSSDVIENLLTQHQRSLLDIAHSGDSLNREKYNVFLTSRINKKGREDMPTASELLDRETMENEIRQIIGDVQSSFQLSRDDEVIILGSTGLILCSKDCNKFEHLIVQYMSMMSRNMFIQSVYRRMFVTVDTLQTVRTLIEQSESDPNNVLKIRSLLSQVSAEVILMRELHGYLLESLTTSELEPTRESDGAVKRLETLLQMRDTRERLGRRVRDIRKNLDSAHGELSALQNAADVIHENKEFKVSQSVSNNTRNMEEVVRANERASTSLEIMQVVLAGSLAFAILDRVHGLYLGVAGDIDWAITAFDWYLQTPMIMFIVNMLWWASLGFLFNRLIKYAGSKAAGVLSIRYTLNCKFNRKAMVGFLATVKPEMEDGESDTKTSIKKFVWDETDDIRWKGEPPKIELVVDVKYGFLLSAFIQIATRKSKCSQSEAKRQFFARLREFELVRGAVPGLETDLEAEYVYRQPRLTRSIKLNRWFSKKKEAIVEFCTF